jgi:UDP:flavonoid glycosyltransferase YjiC (YdhE family)
LDLASSYSPPQDLKDFLSAGDPPVYIGYNGKKNFQTLIFTCVFIGFGSIVVDDPNGLTNVILRAVEKAGVRAIVSKGWGGLSSDVVNEFSNSIYFIGNCPHDWLFKQCVAVVHHGGAGTTAAGLRAGKPTVIVPFFGDQSFCKFFSSF